jgi:transposase
MFAALTCESAASRAASPADALESSERLGRHRRVVERTLAWLNRFRRLAIRYERRADIHEALLHPGCILICWNFIHSKRFC